MDNTICVGSRVRVKDGPDEDELEIVAHEDADPAHGLISAGSPMARALLGHRTGDRVKVARPEDRGAVTVLHVCTRTP
jgi:transcription elongation GreA/GreB family factor